MFKYTIATFENMLNSFKKWKLVFTFLLFGFSIAYYITAIVIGIGNLIINCVSLGVVTAYTIFDFFTRNLENSNIKKGVRIFYNWFRIVIRTVALVFTLIGLYYATEPLVNPAIDVEPAKIQMIPILIIGATLMIVFWILTVLLEIVKSIISKNVNNLKQAIKQDVDDITKPITSVKDAVKKMMGKEVKEKPEKTSFIKKLDKMIDEKKKEKAAKRSSKNVEK